IRIPVADDRPAPGLGDMQHAAANRFSLATVVRQPVHQDSVRALRVQLLEHRHCSIATPIVDEAQAGGGMIGDQTQEVGSAQPVLLVEARNDYADFRHMAKLERPGMRMPARASASEMRPSSVSTEASVRALAAPPPQVARSVGASLDPATRSRSTCKTLTGSKLANKYPPSSHCRLTRAKSARSVAPE